MAEPVATSLVSEYQKLSEETKKLTTEDERLLLVSRLKDDEAFSIFIKTLEGWIQQYEALIGIIKDEDTPETIGFRFLAVKTATGLLRHAIQLPQAIYEANKVNTTRETL